MGVYEAPAGKGADGLVLHYTFASDTGSTVIDQTGLGHDATVSGATFSTQGVPGGSCDFNGNGDYLQAADDPDLRITGDVTVAAWINARSFAINGVSPFGNHNLIVSKNVSTASSEYEITLWSRRVYFFRGNNSSEDFYLGNTVLNSNRWYHIVCVAEGTTGRTYIDGVLDATDTLSVTPAASSDPVRIGRKGSGGDGLYFDGLIDDVRIYCRALSSNEVGELYQLGATNLPPPPPPPSTASISGSVSYGGFQTGTIHVVTTLDTNSAGCSFYCDELAGQGAYSLTNLPTGSNYAIVAFRDTDGDGLHDPWEAYGSYSNNPVLLTGNTAGVDIVLMDDLLVDTDGDGIPDFHEIYTYNTDPNNPASLPLMVGNYFIWPVAFGGNDHWYEIVEAAGGITWSNANTAADAAGGYLATLTSAGENAYVFSFATSNDAVWFNDSNWKGPWIGGLQASGAPEPTGGWTWVTAEAWAYENWAPGEPNDFGAEGFVHLMSLVTPRISTWNDERHNKVLLGYITEYDSLPPAGASAWIAGDVAYAGTQPGMVIVEASGTSTGADTNATPSAYAVSNLTNFADYEVTAYRDSNGNGIPDPWELAGVYSNNPLFLVYDIAGVDIVLEEDLVVDTDNDGLADYSEVYDHGSDPYDEDTDRDGHDDGDEVFAGTSPTNETEVFTVTETEVTDDGRFVFCWSSVTGRIYSVECSTNITDGIWWPLASYTNLPGTGTKMVATNDIPAEDSAVYRVIVSQP